MKRLLVTSLLCLVAAACAPQKPAPKRTPLPPAPPMVTDAPEVERKGDIPPQAPRIKVALLLPLSGESASVGNAMFDAATLALHDTYMRAPSSAIRTQVVLLPKDTGNTPAEATRAARTAIEQGANFIVGPLFSQTVGHIEPVARERGVPMLTFSNNKAIAKPSVFTFGFLPEQQILRMAEYAYLQKYTRIAVLAPNDAYGEKVKDLLTDTYAQKGGMVSPGELYASSPANIDAAVSRLASAYNSVPEERRFQAIFIADGGYQPKNIIKSLKKTSIDLSKIKLLGTGQWDDPEIQKIPELQGAWFTSASHEPYRIFENRFQTTYGYKPVRLASLAYDALTLIAELGMQSPGSDINLAALTDPRGYIGPANGLFRLRPDGTSERKLAVMEIQDARFVILDPSERAFTDKETPLMRQAPAAPPVLGAESPAAAKAAPAPQETPASAAQSPR